MSVENRRVAIVDAVVPLLIEHGPQVSTRQIAEAAGIAEGTIFRVFPDKAALWQGVAAHVLDPEIEVAELCAATAGAVDLRDVIERAAAHLHGRSTKVMAVMMVMRSLWMSGEARHADHKPGEPPPLMAEANRALMSGLTSLLTPYAADLSVEPEKAAVVLRTLVLGSRHPGASSEHQLAPSTIADLMLHGVLARHPDGGPGRRAAQLVEGRA